MHVVRTVRNKPKYIHIFMMDLCRSRSILFNIYELLIKILHGSEMCDALMQPINTHHASLSETTFIPSYLPTLLSEVKSSQEAQSPSSRLDARLEARALQAKAELRRSKRWWKIYSPSPHGSVARRLLGSCRWQARLLARLYVHIPSH